MLARSIGFLPHQPINTEHKGSEVTSFLKVCLEIPALLLLLAVE